MGLTYSKKMKLKGELWLMKEANPGIKPNYSALARETGVSRQTLSRLWKETDQLPKKRKTRKTQFDQYEEEIREKFKMNNASMRSIFMYFQNKYGETSPFRSYNSFKSYVRSRNLRETRPEFLKTHLRYETEPGKELQVDWKESLKMTLKNGETLEYNLFTAVFGYSRYVMFIYSKTRTTEDFIRCLLSVLNKAGGKPKTVKTDNMSAIVNITSSGRRCKLPKIHQLEKDLDIEIQLCKVRSPQSKGKCESANRFAGWLEPYQNELESEAELIQVIETLCQQINRESSRTTGQVRLFLMQKEKEYLRPLDRQALLESYLRDDADTQVVPATLLVTYKGRGYSVPKNYAGKRVKLIGNDSTLQIYYNAELVCVHEISEQPINYRTEDYREGLKDTIPRKEAQTKEDYDQMIEEKARQSLSLMKNLKGRIK